MRTFLIILQALAFLAVLAPSAAIAGSPEDLVQEGNRLLEQGKYDEAIEKYEAASVDAPENPEIYFNKGNAYYRKGDFAKAKSLFEKAALKTKILDLEAKAKYNLGNCSFREGERQKDSDLQKALGEFQSSVRFYQEALKLDPKLEDAAHNIEVARLVMKDILDKLKKEQEKQKKEQKKQQEAAEQLKKLIDEQEQEIKENKALQDEKKKQGDTDETKDKTRQLAKDQDATRKKTKDLAEKMKNMAHKQQPNQPQNPIDKAAKHIENSADMQEKAAGDLKKQKLEDAIPNQGKSLEELKKALASMSNPNENQGKGEDQQKQDSANKESQDKKPEDKQAQAVPRNETAQDILNEEKDNKEKRRVRTPGGYRPVDKDW